MMIVRSKRVKETSIIRAAEVVHHKDMRQRE